MRRSSTRNRKKSNRINSRRSINSTQRSKQRNKVDPKKQRWKEELKKRAEKKAAEQKKVEKVLKNQQPRLSLDGNWTVHYSAGQPAIKESQKPADKTEAGSNNNTINNAKLKTCELCTLCRQNIENITTASIIKAR